MFNTNLPLIPEAVLKAHKVHRPGDTRFRASARLLQALFREDQGLAIGTQRTPDGKRRKLGSRISLAAGRSGANFINPDIAKLVCREVIYREPGAMIDQERLWTNLLSSQPLCFNLFGPLKLDLALATAFFRHLLPDLVASIEAIGFEHSPGRGDPVFTEDGSAFDVVALCTTPSGDRAVVAIEVKYSESMLEPAAPVRPRYDELSVAAGFYRDPAAPELRALPLQQLWREHMLAASMVAAGLYDRVFYVILHPAGNLNCTAAIKAYQRHLVAPPSTAPPVEFRVVTLEDAVAALAATGSAAQAAALRQRYLNFERLDALMFGP
jgi:hypothetical protein